MGLSSERVVLTAALCVLLGPAATLAKPKGFLEGHLQIISPSEVHLAETASPAAPDYAKFPLIILTQSGEVVIQIIADTKGNYHAALRPGNYILDAKGRNKGHLRAKPQPFNVLANQITKVDLTIDTGVR
jgi:hypothetical protein